MRAIQTKWQEDTWSIVCFYIPAAHRRQGVATQLLEAVTQLAFERGAKRIEGYPVVPQADPVPAAFAWTGVPKLFRPGGTVPAGTRRKHPKPEHSDRASRCAAGGRTAYGRRLRASGYNRRSLPR